MAGGRSWTPFSDEDKSLILSMYESGASIRSIASKVSIECSEGAIRNYVKKSGIVYRGAGKGSREITCLSCKTIQVVFGPRKLCETCAPDKAWTQRFTLYQISKPDFEAMLARQSGLCEMCEEKLPDDPFKIHIDHCHKQGHVRGLLCGQCNTGLGYIENDKMLANAVRYIERHKL